MNLLLGDVDGIDAVDHCREGMQLRTVHRVPVGLLGIGHLPVGGAAVQGGAVLAGRLQVLHQHRPVGAGLGHARRQGGDPGVGHAFQVLVALALRVGPEDPLAALGGQPGELLGIVAGPLFDLVEFGRVLRDALVGRPDALVDRRPVGLGVLQGGLGPGRLHQAGMEHHLAELRDGFRRDPRREDDSEDREAAHEIRALRPGQDAEGHPAQLHRRVDQGRQQHEVEGVPVPVAIDAREQPRAPERGADHHELDEVRDRHVAPLDAVALLDMPLVSPAIGLELPLPALAGDLAARQGLWGPLPP